MNESRTIWRYLPTRAWLIGSPVRNEDLRTNSVDALRLGLALLVIISHAYPLSGNGASEPLAVWSHGQTSFGEMAVAGFFALSGYLITRSYENVASLSRYLWHRALRILPGFWVCLLLTACILAPVSAKLVGMSQHVLWSAPDGPLAYITANWGVNIQQWGIAGLPTGIPYPHAFNGSLWTLWVELRCYLIVAVIGALGVLHHARWLVPSIAALLLGALIMTLVDPSILTIGPQAAVYWKLMDSTQLNLELWTCFFIGATAYLYRGFIPLSPLAAMGALVGYFALSPTPLGPFGAALLLSYAMLTIGFRVGATRAVQLRRVGDLSYGTYIYAFPAQQFLAQLGLVALPLWLYALGGVVVTLPLAYISYHVIEAPCMRLKSLGIRKTHTEGSRRVVHAERPELVRLGPIVQQDR